MSRSLVLLILVSCPPALSADEAAMSQVSVQRSANSVSFAVNGQDIAEYFYADDVILRPYFKNLRTVTGKQVTRNSPLQPGDADDHPTMHPGLWLAFGDISGADFWRNKGIVKHEGFLKEPQGGLGQGSIVVRNSFQAGGQTICSEVCSVTISVRPTSYLLDWSSEFQSTGSECTFGDQEEMGLGIRVATGLTVSQGGAITDSAGRKNGKEVWGQQANWCQYSGVDAGRQIGVVLFPHPQNFRRSWFHARDYGLLVANPFGQNAFTKAPKSQVTIRQGEVLHLRFGVLVYETANDAPWNVETSYQEFIQRK